MVQIVRSGYRKTYTIPYSATPDATASPDTKAMIQIQGAAGTKTIITRIHFTSVAVNSFIFNRHTASSAGAPPGTLTVPPPNDPGDPAAKCTVHVALSASPAGDTLVRQYTESAATLFLDSPVQFENSKGISVTGTTQFISLMATAATPTVGFLEIVEEPIP